MWCVWGRYVVMKLRIDVVITKAFAGTGNTGSLATALVGVAASLPVFTL